MVEFVGETTSDGADKRGLDRRTMIKRAAAAGAVAWTAPLIVESLVSPAAAASCPNPAFVGAGALAHGTTSPLVPALPAGVQQNNLILLVTSYRSDAEGVPVAAGYTALTGLVNSTLPAPRLRTNVFYKVAGASESDPSVAFSSIGTGAVAATFVYRCINPAAPFDSTASPPIGRSTASGTTATAPSYAAPANVLVVNVVSGASSTGATFVSASPWNLRASGAGYASTDGPQFIGVADILTTTAAVQAGSSWSTSPSTNWVTLSFALQL